MQPLKNGCIFLFVSFVDFWASRRKKNTCILYSMQVFFCAVGLFAVSVLRFGFASLVPLRAATIPLARAKGALRGVLFCRLENLEGFKNLLGLKNVLLRRNAARAGLSHSKFRPNKILSVYNFFVF